MSRHPDVLVRGNDDFSDHERMAVYRPISQCRDVRRTVLSRPMEDDVFERI